MSRAPDLTVVVPTFDRRPILLRCLAALDAQDPRRGSFEIVVADDGSSDGSGDAVRAAARSMTVPTICSSAPNAGANAARNRALALARGRLLLFLNDDSIARPGLVDAHLTAHAAHPAEGAAGLGRLLLPDALQGELFAELHHDASLDRLPAGTELGWERFFTYNLSVKAALLGQERFDERLRWHEDVELGRRLVARGLSVVFAPDAAVEHDHPITEAGYLRIAEREGEALALWFRSQPGLRDDLVRLGLQAASLGSLAARHRLADLVLTPGTAPAALAVARALRGRAPALSGRLYGKLFQWRKRRAVERTLAATA